MGFRALRALAALLLVATCVASGGGATVAAASPGTVTTQTGMIDGAAYLIQTPDNWNGVLLLYSHGYVEPGSPNPAQDVGDPITGAYLLGQGYALAGSSYKSTGWAVQDALQDQMALLRFFDKTVGRPKQTIAWGHSLGGMITAGLVQRHSDRFAGALPMCGVLAGGVATWNVALDAEFVFKTLAASDSGLQLVNITNPSLNVATAEQALAEAQQTPQGRAHIALAAAVGDIPGWFSPVEPEPASNDFTSQEANQFLWDSQIDFPFGFAFRAEMEQRAGGNPSWNTDVNYRDQLNKSVDREEVRALYAQAGLSLDQDLETLAHTARIAARPSAVNYLIRNIVFNGNIDHVPMLTLHTTGDGLVVNQNEQAYASIVDQHALLRQAFVHRAGHCAFTPAETIAAFNTLVERIDRGHWSGLAPTQLNADAAALGPAFNVISSPEGIVPAPPAYLAFQPTRFPRPFALDDH